MPSYSAHHKVKTQSKELEAAVLLEEDGAQLPVKEKKSEVEVMLKTLKREVGRSKQLRESIMPILL